MRQQTRIVRLNKQNLSQNNFAVATISLEIEANISTIFRNLANYSGKEMFIIGSQNWKRGACNGLMDLIPITYFKNIPEFLSHVKNNTNYSIVSIEQHTISKSIYGFDYPDNPLFIVGNENSGLTDEIIYNSHHVIEIPMPGAHPCLNAGVAAGTVIFDYMRYKNCNKIK